jgi:hypothetical protein
MQLFPYSASPSIYFTGETIQHSGQKASLKVVHTGNSNWLTVCCESADNRSDERSLPIDLVRDGRTRPVAGSIASRNS